jgi:hypothetical protein
MAKNDRRSFDKWQARIRFLNAEHPFGPLEQKRDMLGRLHCDDGPAYISPTRCIWYKEGRKHGLDVDIFGTECYFYENISVPRHYILSPETLTVEEVFQNKNTEVRYVGTKIIGYEKIKQHKVYKHLHSDTDQFGRCWELFQISDIFNEPLTVVQVQNSSPEPDGTFKTYYLQVPPNMKTCRQAVAWTFRKEEKEYGPEQET